MERRPRVQTERNSLIIENVHPPSYETSQATIGGAPETIERIEVPVHHHQDGDSKADASPPSPTFTHATPVSLSTSRSPVYTDSTPTTTLISSRPLSPAFSFTHTLPGGNGGEPAGLESLGREQAGLEVAPGGNFDKEVYFPIEKEVATDQRSETKHPERKKALLCGFPRTLCLVIAAICLLIALSLALGLGLGLGLKHRHKSTSKSSSEFKIGGALDPKYFSTHGAFNGSGIALASQSFVNEEQGTIVLYFQHYTGTIRWKQLRDGDWVGGTQSEIVAYDAKNGTPISAVAYALNNTSTWHIFYIDEANHIRQKTNSNRTNFWQDGPINKLNLTAMDSDSVGLQACWYGSFYGDTDYKDLKPTITLDGSNETTYSRDVGMHLWYASNATTFKQYGWRDGQKDWKYQEDWYNKNGHAGVGCYSWGPGTTTYTMMVNLENTVEIWWKDTNTSIQSTEKHPINKWTNSSAAINNVHPTTSLGYTTFLYAQMADSHKFQGFNMSYHAEDTKIIQENTLTVSLPVQNQGVPLPGTHLSVSAINDHSGGESLIVFYQTEGNDVTEFTRDLFGGSWSYIPLPMDG